MSPKVGEVRSLIRPDTPTRRFAKRAGWALAAGLTLGAPQIAQWVSDRINPPIARTTAAQVVENNFNPGRPSPEFLESWRGALPEILKTYLGIKTEANFGDNPRSYIYQLPTGEMYIWRLQDADTVSEATGYGAQIITNYSLASRSREYQPIFNGLIKGYVTATQYNQNGLMPWRLVKEISRNEQGEIVEIKMTPPSITNNHSATDAELYTAWALIEADQLVQSQVWEAPAEGRDYYRNLAASIISKLKTHCVVEMNGRHILTVSDGWGHPDVLKGAVTVNPSYYNPAALRVFAEFDRSENQSGENYWLKVLRDNFEVFSQATVFSRTMFEELQDPEKRKRHLIQNSQGDYVLDWVHREYINSLLGRVGYELTEFGMEPLEIDGKKLTQKQKDDRRDGHLRADHQSQAQMDRGQLVITPQMLEEILRVIGEAHVVPFVPDQLEVMVEADGGIEVRIEYGESQLSFTEKDDGIRGYRELAVFLLRYDDRQDDSVPAHLKVSQNMFDLLYHLMQGKQAGAARVDQFREIAPLATLLMGAYGTGNSDMARDFEAEFNRYVNENTLFDPTDARGRMPRYFGPTLALLTLTETLRPAAAEVSPWGRVPETVRVEPELERPLPSSGNLLDAPLDFMVDYMTNFGSEPTYPVTARKMARDAQANAEEFRPTRATAHYNAGSNLRNAGKYRAAAEEFYQALQLSRWEENPREALAAMFNIEGILKTLNYGPAEIADIFIYLSGRENLDPKVRLALTGGAVKQLNEAGNYNRALLLGIEFLKQYKLLKEHPSLFDDLRNYSENTDLPSRQLLANVITQIMRAAAQQGRISDFTYEKNGVTKKIQVLDFESELPRLIARILLEGESPQLSGDLGEVLRLIQDLRGEVPATFKPRILLAQAQAELNTMYNLYTQIKHLGFLSPESVNESLGDLDSRYGVFADQRIKILHTGQFAERALMQVLRMELQGERDVFIMEFALRGLGTIHSLSPKILTDLTKQQRLIYKYEFNREGEQARSDRSLLGELLAGHRPVEVQTRGNFFKKERWDINNLDYQKAIFINQVVQNALRGLGIKQYIGEAPVDTQDGHFYAALILAALAVLLRAGQIKKMPKIRKKLAAVSGLAAVLALMLSVRGDAPSKEVEEVRQIFSPEEVAAFLEADEMIAHPATVLSPETYQVLLQVKNANPDLPPGLLVEEMLKTLSGKLSPEARELLGVRIIPGWEITLGPESLRRIIEGVGLSAEEKELHAKLTEEDKANLKDMLQLTRMREAGFLDMAGLISDSASLMAQYAPSADPRNVILINRMLDQANLYMGWAEIPGEKPGPEDLSAEAYVLYERFRTENPDLSVEDALAKVKAEVEKDQQNPDPQFDPALAREDLLTIGQILQGVIDPYANERLDRLEQALKICENSTRIYISNPEHRMDLNIQAVTQMAMLTHKYLEIIRGIVEVETQIPLFSGGLPENMDPVLKENFMKKTALLRARFLAMLEAPEDFPPELDSYRSDPLVQYFFADGSQPYLQEIFTKFPIRRANAYAQLGNTTWWGKKDVAVFIEALGYYQDALEFDYFNVAALYGTLQLYVMDEMQQAPPELLLQQGLTVDRYEVYRTYRRALQVVQRGGVDDNIVSSLINLSGKLWNDELSRDLARIAGGTGSDDSKIAQMLDRLKEEGF